MLLSAILTNNELKNVSIIGGISWPTYWFVFTTRKGGLYFNIAGLGIASIIASIVVGFIKKKKQLGIKAHRWDIRILPLLSRIMSE